MNYDDLKLENQICFPLYAASKEIVRLYKPYLDKIGLTYTQYIAMMVLWQTPKITVKELGNKLYLDSGTLTPMLKRLEAHGLIERSRSQEDERNLIVTLTDKGMKLREQAICIPQAMAEKLNLTEEEIEVLYKLLYKQLDK